MPPPTQPHTTGPGEGLKAIKCVGFCESVPSTVQFYFGCVCLLLFLLILFGCLFAIVADGVFNFRCFCTRVA